MVLPDSHRVPRVPWYSGAVCATFDFSYGAVTLYGQVFQPAHLSNRGSRDDGPTTPHNRSYAVWAVSRSLAATWEITIVFSS
jgi:hypothetical protein